MKSRTTGYIVFVVLIAVGAAVLVCCRSISAEMVYPVERAKKIFSVAVWSRVRGMFAGATACAENVRLKREVAALSLVAGDAERLERENARLRYALEYQAKVPGKWLAAGVLSSGGGSASISHVLRVDKGSLNGVHEGAVVVVPEGLVGRVAEVSLHTAVVLLIDNPSVKVHCEVETGENARLRGVLSGGDASRFVLRHLTGAGDIPPRSRVLTSGLGGVFPRGLEVGTFIGFRNPEAKGLAREGEVLPQVDFSALEDVFIRCEK